ncbi:helix-turn-helix domain-containing protein [Chryseolinea soli]|uniref:Helix-turn-helix domain-containing protein n=1 Tax=Chryseolinea soli TaxID=2321403 RepID=A0A385SP86_9BACT|nr:helix-turn-helix transcriptional regulator [Chryseolinea soli]AYB32346.1 helix-turn-helix domain-containing protein [Chryseolinea soli]
MTTEETPKAHLGRNVRHFRQKSELKQDELADLMGDPWTQKKISQLEAKATIDPDILEEVARALKVSVEEIKEYSEERVINTTQYNYDSSTGIVGPNNHCTFNPLDKLIESHENERKLYEALLKEKDEKIALLSRIFGKEG